MSCFLKNLPIPISFRNSSKDTVDHQYSKQVNINDASENKGFLRVGSSESVGSRVGSRESVVSNESFESDIGPPPKPPHTYYNKHRYPTGGGTKDEGETTHALVSHNLKYYNNNHFETEINSRWDCITNTMVTNNHFCTERN